MRRKYIFWMITVILIALILFIVLNYLSLSQQQATLNCVISIASAVIGSAVGLPTAIDAYKESKSTHIDDDINIINNENKLLNKSAYKFINLEGQINIFIFDERTSKLNNKYNITDYGELYSNCNLYLSEIRNIDNDVLSSNKNIYSLLKKLSECEKKEQAKFNKITKIASDIKSHFNNYKNYRNKLLKNHTIIEFINNVNNNKYDISDKITSTKIGYVLNPFADGLQHMENELNDIVKEIISSNLFKMN